ncbi:MAG: hypothetical protein K6E29_02005 [Cyanobacteria bacterium RUI128]|nr:hypothetical protein [Cyanobacteria bacterium RUI128]
MKKILTILCLLALTTGAANAYPMHKAPHKAPAPQHRVAPKPPMPVVYQQPVYIPTYNGYGYNSPSVTFSVGNVDVTLGL